MSLTSLLQQEITVVRTLSSDRDEIGATQPSAESRVTVSGYLEPASGSEDQETRNTQIGDWRLFLAPDVDVTGWDRVEYQGQSFEILAPPRPFTNPRTGELHHQELDLRRIQ